MYQERSYFLCLCLPLLLLYLLCYNDMMFGVFDAAFYSLALIPYSFCALSLIFYLTSMFNNNALNVCLKTAAVLLFLCSLAVDMLVIIFAVIGAADNLLGTRQIINKVFKEEG